VQTCALPIYGAEIVVGEVQDLEAGRGLAAQEPRFPLDDQAPVLLSLLPHLDRALALHDRDVAGAEPVLGSVGPYSAGAGEDHGDDRPSDVALAVERPEKEAVLGDDAPVPHHVHAELRVHDGVGLDRRLETFWTGDAVRKE